MKINNLIIPVIILLQFSTPVVFAQRSKSDKQVRDVVLPPIQLVPQGSCCINPSEDEIGAIIGAILSSYQKDDYFFDSSLTCLNYLINDTMLVRAPILMRHEYSGTWEEPEMKKLRRSYFPAVLNEHRPVLAVRSELYVKPFDHSDNRPALDTVIINDFQHNKVLGRILFPYSSCDEKDPSTYCSSFANFGTYEDSVSTRVIAIMSFVDKMHGVQYLRGYLMNPSTFIYNPSDEVRKFLDVTVQVPLDIVQTLTPETNGEVFEISLPTAEEYADGRTIYNPRVSKDGKYIAFLAYGRKASSVFLCKCNTDQFARYNDVREFGFYSDDMFIFHDKDSIRFVDIKTFEIVKSLCVTKLAGATYRTSLYDFGISPDGRYYHGIYKGDYLIHDLTSGNEYCLPKITEGFFGEEPVRKEPLMVGGTAVEGSAESLFCSDLALSLDGKYAIGIYHLKRCELEQANPTWDENGKVGLLNKTKIFAVVYPIPR